MKGRVIWLLRIAAWAGTILSAIPAMLALAAVPSPLDGWQPGRWAVTLGPSVAAAACAVATTRAAALARSGRAGRAALVFALPILVGAGYLAWFGGLV